MSWKHGADGRKRLIARLLLSFEIRVADRHTPAFKNRCQWMLLTMFSCSDDPAKAKRKSLAKMTLAIVTWQVK